MWIPLLIGLVLGAAWALGAIFASCEVETKEKWHERNHINTALCDRVYALEAENAKLRVSLAIGEMTEEGKKIAAMTMAALDAVLAADSESVNTMCP